MFSIYSIFKVLELMLEIWFIAQFSLILTYFFKNCNTFLKKNQFFFKNFFQLKFQLKLLFFSSIALLNLNTLPDAPESFLSHFTPIDLVLAWVGYTFGIYSISSEIFGPPSPKHRPNIFLVFDSRIRASITNIKRRTFQSFLYLSIFACFAII